MFKMEQLKASDSLADTAECKSVNDYHTQIEFERLAAINSCHNPYWVVNYALDSELCQTTARDFDQVINITLPISSITDVGRNSYELLLFQSAK